MLRARKILVLVVVIIIIAATWVLAADGSVDQKGVLSGKVLAGGLISSGAKVREGDVLVNVDSIAGPTPAVRANIDGVVKDVLVKPGDLIRTGDVLVRIQPVRK
jgi:biotin carboxyl carrier protein